MDIAIKTEAQSMSIFKWNSSERHAWANAPKACALAAVCWWDNALGKVRWRMSLLAILLWCSVALPPTITRGQTAGNPVTAGPLAAEDGFSLPVSGTAPAGFVVDVRHAPLTQFGDVPLRVVVSPTAATFQEDRELSFRIVFNPQSVTPAAYATNYQFSVKIAQGDRFVDKTVYLPKWFLRGEMRLTVWESGQPISGYVGHSESRGAEGRRASLPAWLEASWLESAVARFGWIAAPGSQPLYKVQQDEIEDLRLMLISLVPELAVLQPVSDRGATLSLINNFGEPAGFQYRSIEELPNQWQGMGQCHIWITQWSTWQAIIKDRPEVALAMRQFIRCGGALWLLNTDPLDQVASQFNVQLSQEIDNSKEVVETDIADGTQPISSLAAADYIRNILGQTPASADGKVSYPLPDMNGFAANQFSGSPLPFRRTLTDPNFAAPNRAGLSARADLWPDNYAWLTQHHGHGFRRSDIETIELGAGMIVCCAGNDALPGSYNQWRHMQERSGSRLSSVINRGIDPINGDARYWNWTIPGVAQPPVYTFIGLLFLFVILVGPISYRKLNRIGRGYLMFFFAPLLAALTTLVLFIYGVVADGLGTQARIRQVTWLCETNGGAVQYWRSTYFAGVRPSAGLRFPSATRIEPYRLNNFNGWYDLKNAEGATQGTIQLSDDSIRLSNGFFPSRQQCQFVAYRPLENAGGLKLAIADQQPLTATVTSQLAYELREVVMRDDEGRYWFCDRLQPNETVTAKLLKDNEATAQLSALYMRQMPAPPIGVILGSGRRNMRMDLVTGLAASEPFRETPIASRAGSGEAEIEWWLRTHLQTASQLPPSTFIATADISDECIATPLSRLVESIHYVIGGL